MQLKVSVLIFFFLGMTLGAVQSFEWISLLGILPMAALLHMLFRYNSYRCCCLFFVFSFAYLAGAVHWIALGIHHPPANDRLDTIVVCLFILVFHSGIHTLCFAAVLLSARLLLKLQRSYVVALALILGWPIAELLRSIGPFAMPWGFLGYSQVNNPVFLGLFPMVGAIGVSGVMWLFATWSESLCTHFFKSKHVHKQLFYGRSIRWKFGFIGVFIIASIASQAIEWSQTNNTFIDVRIVHTHWPDEEKHSPAVRLLALRDLLHSAESSAANLTLYPELYLTMSASEIPAEIRTKIVETSKVNNSALIFGALGTAVFNDGITVSQNVMILLNNNGYTQTYAKEKLLPFTEYLPDTPILRWAEPYLYRYPQGQLLAGPSNQEKFQVNGTLIGITICSELAYSGKASRQAIGANLLLNPSSDSWIASDAYMKQAQLIARVRAAEAQKPMVRPNNVGYSTFIDYKGAVLSESIGAPTAGILRMFPRVGDTPYVRLSAWMSNW
jgi:apolipoprotein N-acyltransferase